MAAIESLEHGVRNQTFVTFRFVLRFQPVDAILRMGCFVPCLDVRTSKRRQIPLLK